MSNIIKIIPFVKTTTIQTKSGEDGRCGLVKEKSDGGGTRSLIPMHMEMEEAEWKI